MSTPLALRRTCSTLSASSYWMFRSDAALDAASPPTSSSSWNLFRPSGGRTAYAALSCTASFAYAELNDWHKADSNPVTFGDVGVRSASSSSAPPSAQMYRTSARTGSGCAARRLNTRAGARSPFQWTPQLRAGVNRLLRLKAEHNMKRRASQRVQTPALLTKYGGAPLTYQALKEAWTDGVERSGVAPTMFQDLRAKALTDKAYKAGVRAAGDLAIRTDDGTTFGARRPAKHGPPLHSCVLNRARR